jgi:hypothetical protein
MGSVGRKVERLWAGCWIGLKSLGVGELEGRWWVHRRSVGIVSLLVVARGHVVVFFMVREGAGEWVVESRLSLVHVVAGSLIWTLGIALSAVLATVPPVLDGVVAATF